MKETDKKNPRVSVLAIAAGLILAGIIIVVLIRYMPSKKRMEPDEYFGVLNEGEFSVTVDDHVAAERAVMIGERLYIDYDLVRRELNPRFHWDDSVGMMLFTTPLEIYEIPLDSASYTIDGAAQDAGHVIVTRTGDKIYFSMEFLMSLTDLTYDVFEDPARVMITYGRNAFQASDRGSAIIRKDSAIRYRGGVKSPILTEVPKGAEVFVLEQMEKWSEVVTSDGYVGYIQNKRLGNIASSERGTYYTEPVYTSLSVNGRLNLVWHQINYEGMNADLAEDIEHMSGVNVISPTWYFLADSQGAVDSFADASYVTQAHEAGLQVWALISNFSENVSTTELLASRDARQKVQNYLISEAKSIGFDGINIDLEGIAESAGYDYVQFMRELSILCRKEGIYLSVDVPVPMGFTSHYDRRELGVVCDYVIMMGYDEHYAGSDITGSVASMDFERTGIANMLREVPKEKVVSAIPFYTRLWYTETNADGSSRVTSEALGMGRAWQVLEENGVTAVWDEDAEQPYGEWTNAEGLFCQLWLEDDSTVAERASFVSENDLGGIAAWVLGNELDYVWSVIEENIK